MTITLGLKVLVLKMFLATLSSSRSLDVGRLVRQLVCWSVGLSVSLLDIFVKKWLLEHEIELKYTYQHTYLLTYICESSESSDSKSQFATKLKNLNCDQQQNININLIAK